VRTKISTKGQIVLPAEFRREDRIEPGEEFEVERIDAGIYRLRRRAPRRNEGLVQLLARCPAKGWFRPLERTETTGDIKAPRLG